MTDSIYLTPGVLAQDQLVELGKKNYISSNASKPLKSGASAIDLCLGTKAWHLTSGQRPTTRELSKIKAQGVVIDPSDGKFTFKRGEIYLVELDEHLALPRNISGRATGKSSVGRLDVITRLITDGNREYDIVRAGYDGPLHLLLMSQTFTIRAAPGESLNQLRFFCGSHAASVITRAELVDYGTRFWYACKEGQANEYEEWSIPTAEQTDDPLLLDLTVDLGDPSFPHIFCALKNVDEPIDLDAKGTLTPGSFFESVQISSEDSSVLLEQSRFYIMKSRERLSIPFDVAVEVVAISERIGDIRIHYAGFAHPGFGSDDRETRKGTPLIFEVRATDMKTKLYHRSVLARIQLFRMSKVAQADPSAYDRQELKLSKVFADWISERA